ncbi:hypothetical protein M0Q50_01165 [bacterium]|jgi:hypothetical protein|nr:hypothetical protein [bacterium]
MKILIHERFLNDATKIRKQYFSNIKKLSKKEDSLTFYKNEIIKTKDEITFFINNSKNYNDDFVKTFNSKLMEIEKNIINIQNEIIPINNDILDLEKQSKFLYNNIKEYYPTLNESDIQKQVMDHLQKLNIL